MKDIHDLKRVTLSLFVASVVVTPVLIAGCVPVPDVVKVHAEVGHSESQGQHAGVGVDLIWNSDDKSVHSHTLASAIAPQVIANEISQTHIHLDLTNAEVTTASGQFRVTLKNGNTVVATRYFALYRSGNNLYPADPSAIANWAENYPNATAANIHVERVNLAPTAPSGTRASMTTSAVYNNYPKASTTNAWIIGLSNCVIPNVSSGKTNPNLPPICRPKPGKPCCPTY